MAMVLPFIGCKFDESSVEIQRFELIDIYNNGNDKVDKRLNNQYEVVYESYLVSGYKRRFDEEIQKMIDEYVCDSIFPNLKFYGAKYIKFYKESKNTNRENFQVPPIEWKLTRAQKDLLYTYRFYNHFLINGIDSVVINEKVIHEFLEMDIYKNFSCE